MAKIEKVPIGPTYYGYHIWCPAEDKLHLIVREDSGDMRGTEDTPTFSSRLSFEEIEGNGRW